ncbi:MAG: T9SS type A sorting domain-containing protein [Nonlabens sp.]
MKHFYLQLFKLSRTFLVLVLGLSFSLTAWAQNSSLNQAFLNWDKEVGCVETIFDKDSQIEIDQFSEDVCLTVCENSTVIYSVNDPNNTVQNINWNIIGGTVTTINSTTISIEWGAAFTSAAVGVFIRYDDGEEVNQSQCVEIIPAPQVQIGLGNLPQEEYCTDTDIHFLNQSTPGFGSDIVAQQWSILDAQENLIHSSNSFDLSYSFAAAGNYIAVLEVWNECNCKGIEYFPISIDGDSVPITCPTVTCEDSIETYSIEDFERQCAAFEWKVEGGTILGSNSNINVTVKWDKVGGSGFEYLSFNQEGCEGLCSGWTTAKIPVVTNQVRIKSNGSVCIGDQATFSIPQWPTTTATWRLYDSNGNDISINQLVPSNQINEIIVDSQGLEPGTYTLKVQYTNTMMLCGGSGELSFDIAPRLEISAPAEICAGIVTVTPSVTNINLQYDIVHEGNLYMAGIGQGPVNFNLNSPGSYIITAAKKGFCLGDPIIVNVAETPDAPNPNNINAPDEICNGSFYDFSYSNPEDGVRYEWEAVNGTISGSAIGATITAQFNGTNPAIKVRAVSTSKSDCVSSYTTINLTPATVVGTIVSSPIANETNFCSSSQQVFEVAPIDGAEDYEWSFATENFGSIIAGQGSETVTVLFNEISNTSQIITDQIRLRVRKCGMWMELDSNGNPWIAPYPVTLNTPTVIQAVNPPSQVCSGGDISINFSSSQNINFAVTDDVKIFVDGVEDTSISFPSLATVANFSVDNISIPLIDPSVTGSVSYEVRLEVIGLNGCLGSTDVSTIITAIPAPSLNLSLNDGYESIFCGVGNINSVLDLNYSSVVPLTSLKLYKNGQGFIRNLSTTASQPLLIPIGPSDGFGDFYVEAIGSNGCLGTSDLSRITQVCDTTTVCGAPPVTMNAFWSSCTGITATGSPTAGYIPGSVLWRVDRTTASLTTQNDTSASFMVTEEGNYRISYSADYLMPNNNICTSSASQVVTVGYKAQLEVEAVCGLNGLYDISFANTSRIVPGHEPSQTTYTAINNTTNVTTVLTAQNSNPRLAQASLPAGNYTFEVKLERAGAPTCTATQNLNIEAVQVPTFQIKSLKDLEASGSITETCAECPVQLLIDGEPDPDLTYKWEFSDTSNLVEEPMITLNTSINGGTIKLIATDAYGCEESSTQTVTVNESFQNFQIAGNLIICDNPSPTGPSTTLIIAASPNSFQSPNPVQWMRGHQEITGATNLSYVATQEGSYWAKLYDPNGCESQTSTSKQVVIKDLPYIEFDVPASVCKDQDVSFNATVDQGAVYTWSVNGNPVSYASLITSTDNSATLDYDFDASGFYTVALNVQYDGCSNTQSFTVEVVDADAFAIVINDFLCSPYTVELKATGVPSNASIRWSDGSTGSNTIDVSHGGLYRATLTLESGCTYTREIEVPYSPQAYEWIFPTGCVEFCLEGDKETDVDRTIITPGPVDYNTWLINGNVGIYSGSNLPALDLAEVGSSIIQSEIYNGACELTTGTLEYNKIKECTDCEISVDELSYEFNEELGGYAIQGAIDLTGYSFPLTLRFYGEAFTYSNQGYMNPNTIELLTPQSVYNFPPLMYYLFGNGQIGDLNLIIEIEDTSGLCQNTFILIEEEIETESEEDPAARMRIIPNPVEEQAKAIYLIPENMENNNLKMSLYSMQGILLFEREIKNATHSGEMSLPVHALPTGSYYVKLTGNGENLVQEILIKK